MIFGSAKEKENGVSAGDIETVVGKSTTIKGEIGGAGNLRVDGKVEGGINVTGAVIVGETGIIEGDVTSSSLRVSGLVKGNATVAGLLAVHSMGQMIGDVKVNSLNIEDGGVFKGRSEMTLRNSAENKENKSEN